MNARLISNGCKLLFWCAALSIIVASIHTVKAMSTMQGHCETFCIVYDEKLNYF